MQKVHTSKLPAKLDFFDAQILKQNPSINKKMAEIL